MEINEIKKELYKQKPTANLMFIRVGNVYYDTTIKNADGDDTNVMFIVPVNDMGEADFFPEMDAKLLIRYINNNK